MTLPQEAFIERLRGVLAADERIRSAWLTGSFGTGTADEFSDVDTTLVVDDDSLDAVVAGWDALIAPLGERVLRKFRGQGIVNHVYPGWLRWDAVLQPRSTARVRRGRARALFDRDGLEPAEEFAQEVDAGLLDSLQEEYWRSLGLLPVTLGRGDLAGARLGAGHHEATLVLLLKALDERERTGMLHLHTSLTPEHYAALSALPPLATDRASIVAHVRACTEMFVGALDEALPQRDKTFERAAIAHVASVLPEWA